MASLKEIKNRISSVRSTLKITSAMKMVASAKLHWAQSAIGNMLPYQEKLNRILSDLMVAAAAVKEDRKAEIAAEYTTQREVGRVAILAFSSNSSLCGGFNSNVIKKVTAVIREYEEMGAGIVVYSVGRKMADAMKKMGYPSPEDYSFLSEKPSYAAASSLAGTLIDGFINGDFDRIELVYNHFKSTSSQPTLRQAYLPMEFADLESAGISGRNPEDYIIEPGPEEDIRILLPNYLRLKVYTVLLDTSAAEHAARTVAMQTATDNGNDLLDSLTLEYNKGRQQKITNELLDIAGGAQAG